MNDDIEKKILGYMLFDKQYLVCCIERLKPSYFEQNYRKLFVIIKSYFQKYKEIITVNIIDRILQSRNVAEDIRLMYSTLLNEIINDEYKHSEFEYYLNEMIKKECKKILISSLDDCIDEQLGKNIPGAITTLTRLNDVFAAKDILKKAVLKVEQLSQVDRIKEGDIKDSVEYWRSYVNNSSNNNNLKGIATGIHKFDELSGGLQGGRTLCIVGQTGSGKSILMLCIGKKAWLDGYNVVYFSLEMEKEMIERRFISSISYLDSNKIRDSKLNDEEKKIFYDALQKIENDKNKFYIVDIPRGCTPLMLEAKIEAIKVLFEPHLIIIDYLNIMSPTDTKATDAENQGILSEEIHELARYYRVPIIFAAQATSLRKKDEKMEIGTHRVGRSERIATNTDFVLQIQPDEEPELSNTMVLHIIKGRDCASGVIILKKDFANIYSKCFCV